jgi:hypothetical protein
VGLAVRYLSGELRQRRTGVGHRSLAGLPEAADTPSLTLAEVDAAFEAMGAEAGAGATGRRRARLHELFARATASEQRLLAGLVGGELRQGAQVALVTDAVAVAAGVPLRDLRTAVTVTRPALEFIAPYQTVCNYANYFLHPLGEHQSQVAMGGTVQNQGAKLPNPFQPNNPGSTESSRPWDLHPGEDPYGATFLGLPAGRLFVTPYQPAIDAQGNADCQNGQQGMPRGPLTDPWVRDYKGVLADGTPAGGNAGIAINNYPGLAGGTYKSRELGIDNLKDVP